MTKQTSEENKKIEFELKEKAEGNLTDVYVTRTGVAKASGFQLGHPMTFSQNRF